MSSDDLRPEVRKRSYAEAPLMRSLTEPVRGGIPSRLSPGLHLLLWMLKGLRIGSLEVQLPDGRRRHYRGSEQGPHGMLQIREASLVRQVLRGGEIGFGEAYMDGRWDSPDLAALLAVMYLNEPHYKGPYERMPLARLYGRIQNRRRANTRRGARENIQYHYDLGNDFYALWLDDTMTYSSAVFGGAPNESLRQAQLNKFEKLYRRLQLRADQHLLEIGSGWGAFAVYCAQQSGCRVTGITLSEEQLRAAQARAARAGLSDRVRFELRDYRDLQGRYDRIASIEMYEAVGERYWPMFFETLARVLAPGGIAALQGITIADRIFEQYRGKRDFIQKYIFPGGMLAPPQRLMELAGRAGLAPVAPRFFGPDYAETLARWHRNLIDAREAVRGRLGERFYRMWRYYLAYCECGFRVGSLDLMQLSLRKPT